ncbi:hypothetical protein VTI28DRAFT_2034 [Corynascus sepedonium]
MVKIALSLVGLAMAASVAAAPAPSAEASAAVTRTTFSFEAWVEDIIANPDTALTVDEALAAAEAADVVGSAGGLLSKRATCDPSGWARANARDATSCVNDLARKGGNGVQCAIGQGQFNIQMCSIGNAKIVGIKNTSPRVAVNCNDIARTAGKIFDSCWRSDDTIVGSQYCITNNKINVGIHGA